MPRPPRSEQFDPRVVGILHCMQRCVRRAFLAGRDSLSGIDYSFRREWIRCRMERLASVFGIDILSYAILSNHMHLVLRNRPDVVETWSDEEVALRWLRVFPGKRIDEQLSEPPRCDVQALASNRHRLGEIRLRLSNPSWFMRALCEPIARLANKQDQCTGSFWQGRFKAQAITDEASLLACSMYVDLNPIRAALAATPEESLHTSVYDRIQALKGAKIRSAAADLALIETKASGAKQQPSSNVHKTAKTKGASPLLILRDAWLAPMTLSTRLAGQPKPLPSQSGLRASDRGFLSMPPEQYITILDWLSHNRPLGKRESVPANLAPILKRLGIEANMLSDLVWNYQKYFGSSSAAGSPASLKASAAKRNRRYTRGQRSAAACFL